MCKMSRSIPSVATTTTGSCKVTKKLCWAESSDDEDIDDLPQSWGNTESGTSTAKAVSNAAEGKTATQSRPLRAAAPEWTPAPVNKTTLRASAPEWRPAYLDTPKQVQEGFQKHSSCSDNSAQAMRTGETALQVQRGPSSYEAWVQKQEPYVQALLPQHDCEAQRHLFSQTRWLERGRISPRAFLEACCEEGIPVPLQSAWTFPSREEYYSYFHTLPEPSLPTPYVVASAQQRQRQNRKGSPRPFSMYHIPYEAISAPVSGTPKPIMRIDSRVQFMDHSYSTAAAAGTPQLSFGSFMPGEELLVGVMSFIPAKFTVQDMLKSFQTSEAADCGTPARGSAAEADSAARESMPEPEEAAGQAVAAMDLYASDSLIDDILHWGDNLQQETPQKEDKDLSIHPIFSIAVDCTSALSMPSVLDAPSSNPSLTSPGVSAAAAEPVSSQEEPLEHAETAAAGEELHLAPADSRDASVAASGYEAREIHAHETAQEATAAGEFAVSVPSMVDESEGVEEDAALETSSEPEELHLAPTQTADVSAAASGHEAVEEHAAETAQEATAAEEAAVPISSLLDESEGEEQDTAQELSSEPALDAHSAASTPDEQSYYSALSSPPSSIGASEDMSQYDASMDELQLMSGDASSEDSMPSMLDTQSTYPAMASAASSAASEALGQQSSSMGETHEVQLAPADITDLPTSAAESESAESQASVEETNTAELESVLEISARMPDVQQANRMAAGIVKAGCLAGAALEVALEAPVAVSHCLLGQPKPADGGPAVRLFRRTTTSAYVAAGHMVGLADAARAATRAFARFLF